MAIRLPIERENCFGLYGFHNVLFYFNNSVNTKYFYLKVKFFKRSEILSLSEFPLETEVFSISFNAVNENFMRIYQTRDGADSFNLTLKIYFYLYFQCDQCRLLLSAFKTTRYDIDSKNTEAFLH